MELPREQTCGARVSSCCFEPRSPRPQSEASPRRAESNEDMARTIGALKARVAQADNERALALEMLAAKAQQLEMLAAKAQQLVSACFDNAEAS